MKYLKYLIFAVIAFIFGNFFAPFFGFGCSQLLTLMQNCSNLNPYDIWGLVIVVFLLEILLLRILRRHHKIANLLKLLVLFMFSFLLSNLIAGLFGLVRGCLILPTLDQPAHLYCSHDVIDYIIVYGGTLIIFITFLLIKQSGNFILRRTKQ